MTLVGLLVAMTLMLLVMGAAIEVFGQFNTITRKTELQNDAQDRARTAVDRLSIELRNLASPTPESPQAVQYAGADRPRLPDRRQDRAGREHAEPVEHQARPLLRERGRDALPRRAGAVDDEHAAGGPHRAGRRLPRRLDLDGRGDERHHRDAAAVHLQQHRRHGHHPDRRRARAAHRPPPGPRRHRGHQRDLPAQPEPVPDRHLLRRQDGHGHRAQRRRLVGPRRRQPDLRVVRQRGRHRLRRHLHVRPARQRLQPRALA